MSASMSASAPVAVSASAGEGELTGGREVRARADEILGENARDVAAARSAGQTAALIDRLTLDPGRLAAIADAKGEIFWPSLGAVLG